MNYTLGQNLANLIQLAREYQKQKDTWSGVINYSELLKAIHNEIDKEFGFNAN